MSRREFTSSVKRAAYERSRGRCEKCGKTLAPGVYWFDHIIPDGIGGEPTLDNCQVICLACDRKKTPGDQTRVAKTKRQRAKHDGTYRLSRHPMRHPTLRKKISGEVVTR